ncbi:DUF6737 family protein [Crocosphaera sp. UHCC 0190]|uniref:DUF6737 family protein n=1 Tax=Crocosphaera sp. UHCC 0190 TaxID=3110246 RepID=UPI002B21CA38|nr:DUF6737 family protein [Crocosphaera sp. UHCC 0190]MEA5511681.1 DUF6737 family protein [Crocosphaera sp. UHCC 0190]
MTESSEPKSTNIWDYKPWWCQPWSIILTGILLVSGLWLITKFIWLTLGLALLIMIWWVYFLLIYPRMFKEYLEHQTQ